MDNTVVNGGFVVHNPAETQRVRLNEIMRRHVRGEDIELTDDAFIRAVFKRYAYERGMPLLDPNE